MTAITLPSPTAKLSLGNVIRQTFEVLSRNLGVLLILIAGCLVVPGAVMGVGLAQATSQGVRASLLLIGLGYILLSLGSAILLPAMFHATVADLNGRRAVAGECLRTGLKNAVPVFLIFLLSMIAIGFGFILLVVPGVMMGLAWLVAGPSQVVEKTGVFGAFSRSAALTRNNRWRLFGLLLIYFIVYSVIQQVLMNVVGAGIGARMAAAQAGNPFSILTPGYWIVMAVLTVANSLIAYVGVAVIYFELRRVKEGVGPEALASVFD